MEKFEKAELHLGDCIDIMNSMEKGSVDVIVVDLPYGTTQNKWDVIIPFDKLWDSLLRVTKETSNMVFTASQPFTSQLVCSNLKMFRHEIIWEKTIGSGQFVNSRLPDWDMRIVSRKSLKDVVLMFP